MPDRNGSSRRACPRLVRCCALPMSPMPPLCSLSCRIRQRPRQRERGAQPRNSAPKPQISAQPSTASTQPSTAPASLKRKKTPGFRGQSSPTVQNRTERFRTVQNGTERFRTVQNRTGSHAPQFRHNYMPLQDFASRVTMLADAKNISGKRKTFRWRARRFVRYQSRPSSSPARRPCRVPGRAPRHGRTLRVSEGQRPRRTWRYFCRQTRCPSCGRRVSA